MYSKRTHKFKTAHCWMQIHSCRWPSTQIPSRIQQPFPYRPCRIISKPHYVGLITRVSCALNTRGLSEAWQGTLFLIFTAYFHVLPRLLFPSSSTLLHFAGGRGGADHTPTSLSAHRPFSSSWAETGSREVFGWQKGIQPREAGAANSTCT